MIVGFHNGIMVDEEMEFGQEFLECLVTCIEVENSRLIKFATSSFERFDHRYKLLRVCLQTNVLGI